MIRIACSHDGSWLYLTGDKRQLAVSPAAKGAGFVISDAGRIVEDGFETEAAAVAQAEWLLTQ